MAEERTERAQAVQARHTDELMAKAHVQGVAVGLAKEAGQYTGDVAIVVMVDQKVPVDQLAPEDVIPHELEGVRVDVQEMGIFSAQ
ncbi:MAG: hypothetical protein K8J31_01050 [Anaerolineae bacterium]|nr:hypothetical protein [Anaerolineae bacterium]